MTAELMEVPAGALQRRALPAGHERGPQRPPHHPSHLLRRLANIHERCWQHAMFILVTIVSMDEYGASSRFPSGVGIFGGARFPIAIGGEINRRFPLPEALTMNRVTDARTQAVLSRRGWPTGP